MKQSEKFLVWMCPENSPGPSPCWYFHKNTWTRVYWASRDQSFMLLVSQLLQKWLWNVGINRAPALVFVLALPFSESVIITCPFWGRRVVTDRLEALVLSLTGGCTVWKISFFCSIWALIGTAQQQTPQSAVPAGSFVCCCRHSGRVENKAWVSFISIFIPIQLSKIACASWR